MIIDTSAIMALALNEAEASAIAGALSQPEVRRMSAGSWLELQAVSTRRFAGSLDQPIVDLRKKFAIEIVAVTQEQSDVARNAYRTFGLGTLHPARLNFGDCFAYALAKTTGEPLLFKGDDFTRTDITSAL